MARQLASELVAQGVVVVSGLAAGIDAAAHQGAMETGGRTIAVIGTPLAAKKFAAKKSGRGEEASSGTIRSSEVRCS
jgi:DNA processing protein